MRRFVIQVIAFLAIIVVIDFASGFVFQHIESNAKGGFTYRDNYICNQLETDILVSGSSRCVRHYNPEIITDSLGMTCYNSGQMGNGIILNYGRIKMIGEHKRPSVIIYDLQPNFDFLVGEDNHRYLTWLKSHYDRDGISDIFESIDKTEQYKMMSKMYRYNSRWLELLIDFLHPIADAREDGFSPLKGDLDHSKIRLTDDSIERNYKYDELKLSYIRKMIEETQGAKLYFVVSPIWYGMDSMQFRPIKEICEEKGIPFCDFSNNPKYVRQDVFFKDGNHMNEYGANEFTRDLVAFLRKQL